MNNFAPLEMSVRQGAKLWNIAPNTIYDRIRKKELQLNENWKITPTEMSRIFGSPRPTKKIQWTSNIEQWTAQTEQLCTVQISLLEQALHFEQERTKDLQQQLNEAKQHLQSKETQIFELLRTIKDLSQGIKRLETPKTEALPQTLPRKKFLGIF